MGVHAVKHVTEPGTQRALGCHVEQVELARGRGVDDLSRRTSVQRRVEEGGAHTEQSQALHLVVHESDER